jgi:carbon-monoxide dehydrogenase medium subunit
MTAFEYLAPRTISEVIALLTEKGEKARILAGGTDIIVQVREGRRAPDWLVDIKHVPEVNELTYDPARGLTLGAAVPCYRIYEHPDLAVAYPGLIDAVSLVGGIQIQSRASVGGNLCNASPAADTIPPLIAGEAVCIVAGPEGRRELPVENFCIAPGRTALRRGEFLVALRLPPPRQRSGSAYLRFIPRNEMDIAVVGAGVSLTLDESRNRCTAARIALAAVAPSPLLVNEAASALVGGTLQDADIERCAQVARAAARPISDMRGDADFRRHLVGILVQRSVRIASARAKER